MYVHETESLNVNQFCQCVPVSVDCLDDLPVRNYLGRLDEEGLFPHEHKVFLYSHHHFILEFNGYNVCLFA